MTYEQITYETRGAVALMRTARAGDFGRILHRLQQRDGVVAAQRFAAGLDDHAADAQAKPATLDGKPVEVFFNLTVNAKLAR